MAIGEWKLDVAASADLIVDGAVTAVKLAADSVTADKILANSVIAGKTAADAVGATEIAAKAITVNKLAVLPYNHNPDPLFLDESAWLLMGAWQIVVRGTAMFRISCNCRERLFWTHPYGQERQTSVMADLELTLPESSRRFGCASLYNNSNWGVRVGLYYYSQGACISESHR